MVSNDSGLMHVATAVKTPVVALIGPTDPTRTAPPWKDCRVLQIADGTRLGYPFTTTHAQLAPLPEHYWKEIAPMRVLDAVDTVLRKVTA